jgi:uncharacterized membrane protein
MNKFNQLLTATLLSGAIALAGAAYAESGKDTHKRGEWAKHRLEQQAAKLPPEKAKILQDAMKGVHDKNEAIFTQVKKLREEGRTLMTAPTFDKAAWLANSNEIMKLQGQAQSNRQEAFAGVAAQLTADERKALASVHHKRSKGDDTKSAE